MLIAFIPAALIYFNTRHLFGFICAILILLGGLIIGLSWANRISKRQGTQQFLSRISGSPEFDAVQQEAIKEKEKSEQIALNTRSKSNKID